LNPNEIEYNKDKDQFVSLIENNDNEMKVEDLYKSMSETNNENENIKEDQYKNLIENNSDIIDYEIINSNKIQNNKFHYSYK